MSPRRTAPPGQTTCDAGPCRQAFRRIAHGADQFEAAPGHKAPARHMRGDPPADHLSKVLAMAKNSALPNNLPPRLLSREQAAAYLNLSPNSFDGLVSEGDMPKPMRLTNKRKLWDLHALDAAIDRIRAESENPRDQTWEVD